MGNPFQSLILESGFCDSGKVLFIQTRGRQRTWGRGLPWEEPIVSCSDTHPQVPVSSTRLSCCCCVASVMSDPVQPHRQQPTSSPVHGIFQARVLAWAAISFSTRLSYLLFITHDLPPLSPCALPSDWNFLPHVYPCCCCCCC